MWPSGAVGGGSRGALGSTIAARQSDHEPPGRSSRDEGARDGGDDDDARGDVARAGVHRRPRLRRRRRVGGTVSGASPFEPAPHARVRHAYPWIHAGWEAVVFWCWLRYLLKDGTTHDPSLATLRLAVVRASPSEMTARRARVGIRSARRGSMRLSLSPSWMTRVVGADGVTSGSLRPGTTRRAV